MLDAKLHIKFSYGPEVYDDGPEYIISLNTCFKYAQIIEVAICECVLYGLYVASLEKKRSYIVISLMCTGRFL